MQSTAPAPPPGEPERPPSGRRSGRWHPKPSTAAAIAYVSGMFMATMDMHIINVALPSLGRAFGAPISDVQWTVIAYLLTLAVVIPASGWIGDRIGTKRTFLFALVVFTVASALCGAAQSLGELIAARALQGIGGGMLTPTATAMLYRAYGPEQRARVARTVIVPVLLGPGIAPVLGGALTQTLSWRWVFFVNIPVGLATLAFAHRFLREYRGDSRGRLDWRGLILSGVSLSALMYAVSEGSVRGWSSPEILVTGIGGVWGLLLFARQALHRTDPILRLGLLRDRLFRATNIVFPFTTGPFLGSLYLTPIFLQEVLHQSPLGSGTTTFVEAIGVIVAAQTLGRLYPRLGPRIMAGIGSAGLAIYMGLFLLIDAHTNLWLVRALMFYGGACNSGTFLSLQSSMFTTISSEDTGHASAIYNTQRQSSIAINIAVLTTVVTGVGGGGLAAFHGAYLAGTIISVVGAVLAWTLIRTEDARSTMIPRR
ncbi:MAG TPA: DHA2 family efflux MFS transporter permease subunit [Solirubrobacteraceae bacterium]|nr:DHA2 family efflux MFS transporter permease subunit [Solirubrobacteraceae bacterium]